MHTPTSFAFDTLNEERQGFKYSSSQWDVHKSSIRRLYILENRTAIEIVDILSRSGFPVTERQLKHRLKKWQFNTKNVKGVEMLEMARLRLKRNNANGKPSAFMIKKTKKLVGDANIDRFLERKNISESSLLSMASPIDDSTPGFNILTPSASSLEDVEENAIQADVPNSSTMLYPQPTSNSPKVYAYPTSSSPSFYDNPKNFREHPWSSLKASVVEPPDLTTADWIQDNPSPVSSQDAESQFFDFSKYDMDHEMDLEETVSIPTTPLCSQAEEENRCREQLDTTELLFGPNHVETLDAQRSLALELYKGAQFEPAEALLRKVVESGQNGFGENHLTVLESRLHLSIVIQEQGRYSEAEHLQRELLDNLIKSTKEDHRHTLQTKLTLALTLICPTRYYEAAHIQHEVLKACQERFGSEDPFTIQVMGDLALSQVKKGIHHQSVRACRFQWDAWNASKGETHPQTIAAKLNTAIALSEVGNYKGSHTLAYEIWSHGKLALGSEHPDTLRAEGHLAFCMDNQALHGKAEDRPGLHAQAEEIYRRVWTNKKRILGAAHPDTLQSLLDVALHLQRRCEH